MFALTNLDLGSKLKKLILLTLASKHGRSWFKRRAQLVTFFTKRPCKQDNNHDEYAISIADDPFRFATDHLFTIQRGFLMLQNAFFNNALQRGFLSQESFK